MADVRIRLLGGLEILRGGEAVALPARKQRALVAILAARPGAPVPRARLAGLLWSDRPDEQGRASLRQAATAVRRALGAGSLDGAGDALALVPAAAEVDLARLEAAMARGEEGWPALVGGPFLAGFAPLDEPFDDWAEETRIAVERRVLAGFARVWEGGAASAGLDAAASALEIDPAHEPAWRARMRLLAARGERAAALREYERCRAALARALSVEPAAATERLRREIEAAPAAGARPSLAVLPFGVLTDDPDHVLFSRGLAEDVLVALSRFRTLRVAASGSAERLAGEGLDAAGVGRALGVGHVLTGTVRAGAGRLRVAAHLVDVATGRQAWAERFEGDVADLFALQDRIVEAVASALSIEIDGRALREAAGRAPDDLDAYACWVRGMARLRAGTFEADLEARRLFERARALDPSFARAHVGLSLSYFNDWSCAAWERWDENERRAFEHALDALRLDDRDHVAHVILARVLAYRREFDRAELHAARALALNANDPDALAQLSLVHAYLGEPERAVGLGAAARRLHPFHPDWYFPCLALGAATSGAPRDALALCGRSPDAFVVTRALMAACHAALGELASAEDCARRYVDRFRASVARSAHASADEAIAWLLRVNPLRREIDRALLLDGLARAGVRAATWHEAPAP